MANSLWSWRNGETCVSGIPRATSLLCDSLWGRTGLSIYSYLVWLIAVKGCKAKSTKGKCAWGQVQTPESLTWVESQRRCLVAIQHWIVVTLVKCCLPKKVSEASAPQSHRHPVPSVSKPILQKESQVLSINHKIYVVKAKRAPLTSAGGVEGGASKVQVDCCQPRATVARRHHSGWQCQLPHIRSRGGTACCTLAAWQSLC